MSTLPFYLYKDQQSSQLVPSFNANIVYGSIDTTSNSLNILYGNKNMIELSNDNGLLCKKEGIYKIRITLNFTFPNNSTFPSNNAVTFSIKEVPGVPLTTDMLPVYISQDVFELITQQCILSLGYLYSTGSTANYTLSSTSVVDQKYYVPTINIPAVANSRGLSVIEAILYLKKDTKTIYFNVTTSGDLTNYTVKYNYTIESLLFIDPIPDITILDDDVLYNMSNSGILKSPNGNYSYIEFYCTNIDSIGRATIKFNKTGTPLFYILVGAGGGGANSNAENTGSGGGGGGVFYSRTTSSNKFIPTSTTQYKIKIGKRGYNAVAGETTTLDYDNTQIICKGGRGGGKPNADTTIDLNTLTSNTINYYIDVGSQGVTIGGNGTPSRYQDPTSGSNGSQINLFGVDYNVSGAGGGGNMGDSSPNNDGGQGGQNNVGGKSGLTSGFGVRAGGNGNGYGTGGGGAGTKSNTGQGGDPSYGGPGLVVFFWPTPT